MRTKNFPEKQNQRRLRAFLRLEAQLESGIKSVKVKPSGINGVINLSEEDKVRIKKEMSILDKKIVYSARDRRTKKRRSL